MADGYYKDVVKLLKQHKCHQIRQDGSHQTWSSPVSDIKFTVSTNLYSRHTANAIMKAAGINHKF